jgi:hypothetical protein
MTAPATVFDFLNRGWRPALGWAGVAIALTIGLRSALGMDVGETANLIVALTPVLIAYAGRFVERLAGRA